MEYATPLQPSPTLTGGPQVTVLGTPAPFAGAMTFAGSWLYDTFHTPLAYSGHERNFQAYVNTLTLQPGTTRSLLHFVVLGRRVDETTSAAERAAVEGTATSLATSPPIGDLSAAEICSVANFDIASLSIPGFDAAACRDRKTVQQPAVPPQKKGKTSVKYDVVEKTIAELRADMEAGIVTSQEITRAYLDRIGFYDQGQFGFHAYEIVAGDAMRQANEADRARRKGASGALLGIPIIIKNNYDTFDMPTTNGSFTFAGFRPARDAFQVARLREAGAVIIGKGALEEYATFGHWSNDAWGQVWSVFNPSRSPLASSGGSASAVAGSLAAAAMGSQTGDSLYAPASAQSLVTLRGTDGLESGTGIQPLVWMTDFGGAITRSVSDLADMLNVVTGIDPEDPATLAQARRRGAPRLALGAGHRSAARHADWLRGFSLGRRVRPDRAAVWHQRHDRRDAERAASSSCRPAPPSCRWASWPRRRRRTRRRRRRNRSRPTGSAPKDGGSTSTAIRSSSNNRSSQIPSTRYSPRWTWTARRRRCFTSGPIRIPASRPRCG